MGKYVVLCEECLTGQEATKIQEFLEKLMQSDKNVGVLSGKKITNIIYLEDYSTNNVQSCIDDNQDNTDQSNDR